MADLKGALAELSEVEVKKIGGINASVYLSVKDKVLGAGVPETVFYRKPGAVIEGIFNAVANE